MDREILEMRIICCKFGKKYTNWHVRNLKHMIDEYSGLKYDSFEVIEDDLYGNWFNKFQMYDRFRDGENLYFDLDIIIYNKVPNLIRKDFTLLNAWWRDEYHTPLNSSIVSWTGDVSFIWDKFKSAEDYYLTKYWRGSDEFYYKEIKYNTYDKVCYSIQENEQQDKNYSICLLNQNKHLMDEGWSGWWKNYFVSSNATDNVS